MTKAKIGDQRFKKKSYIPYIVAVASLLFLILGVMVGMWAMFDMKGRNNDRLNERLPVSQTDWAPTIKNLWFRPNRIPADVVIKPPDRIAAQGDEICVMFTSPDGEPKSHTVYVTFSVDFKTYVSSDYVPTPRDEFYCIQPVLEKGYHLITMNTLSGSDYEWAILVE